MGKQYVVQTLNQRPYRDPVELTNGEVLPLLISDFWLFICS